MGLLVKFNHSRWKSLSVETGGGRDRLSVMYICVYVCVDKSHWDLIVKHTAYVDSLLAVLEVGCPVYITCS